jgi:hypothetical protein
VPARANAAGKVGGANAVFGELPKDCAVQAIGIYHGTADVKDVQLDRSGHQVRQAEVVVNAPDHPVVLVLTAYDPTVWRVGRTEKTRLVGVVVSGYHGQALIGIEKTTPHVVMSKETSSAFADGRAFYAYNASPELLAMNDAVKQLVGREIDHFENRLLGGAFRVGARVEPKQVIYSNDLKVSDFAAPPKQEAAAAAGIPELPAGQKGLDDLVAEGSLRAATNADVAAWVDKASEPYKRFNGELRVEAPPQMQHGRAYVVLKNDVTLPDGLFGAHSRAFIIPDGVADPKGSIGHCTFYRMNGTEDSVRTRAQARMAEAEGRFAEVRAKAAEAEKRLKRDDAGK